MWDPIDRGDNAEDWDGTAAAYGREVLRKWFLGDRLPGFEETAPTDEHGNPTVRVRVFFAPYPDTGAALITSDDLAEPSAEIAAVEAAREGKLYVGLLDRLADEHLGEALTAARAAGHDVEKLADLAYPAALRPAALRMMES